MKPVDHDNVSMYEAVREIYEKNYKIELSHEHSMNLRLASSKPVSKNTKTARELMMIKNDRNTKMQS